MQYHCHRAAAFPNLNLGKRVFLPRLLSVCGLIVPFIFLIGIAIVGWQQPDYNTMADTVSKMGRVGRPYAELANSILIVSGILIAIFAQGLPRLKLRFSGGLSAQNLLATFGLFGLAGAGLLPCDEYCAGMSSANILHTLPVAIGFGGLQLALLRFARRDQREPFWIGIREMSLTLFWAGLFALAVFVFGRWGIIPWLESYAGFSEKIYLALLFVFIFIMAKRLYVLSSPLIA